ncbi:MAG TPA: ketoacyl-ACP synthase III family protein [Rugosimonospora sp.]|nr:ketoacyl-ACP synthase III family protein [Rugosimonospora sp.]
MPDERIRIADPDTQFGIAENDTRLLTRFLGLSQVATAGTRPLCDLLVTAGRDALAGADHTRVRYLIHAHTVHHVAPPELHLAHLVREQLGLPAARAFAMSHQACTAGIYALNVAEWLLLAEPAGSTALILAGEKVLSRVTRHLPGITVVGDGAAAVLVSLDGPGDVVLGLAHRTLGEFHEGGNMPAALRGRYQRAYTPTVAAVIREALAGAGLDLADVSLVLPHNVNRYSWSGIARYLGLPLDRVYLENIAQLGHCHCADPFINLACARDRAALHPGDVAVLVSVGQGGTFSAAAVRVAQ